MPDEHDKRADLTVRWTRAQPNVAAFIRSIVRDPHEVEDLLQDVAYRIAVRFDAYDPAQPFVAWAIGIARNCIHEWRRAARREVHLFDNEAIQRIADANSERAGEHERIRLTLEHCLGKLTPSSRRLLDLRYAQDMKPARIAELLESTPASVSSTLYRVREMLRECIEATQAAEGRASS